MSRSRIIGCMALALAVTLAAGVWLRPHIEAVEVGVDDANIFFVYARNLANGHGFVWTVGGPRVEGFSSPLWVLLITPFFVVSSHPEFPLFLVSTTVVATGFAMALCRLTANTAKDERPNLSFLQFALAAVWMLWCFHQPLFTVWNNLTLMETGLWSALLLLATTITVSSVARPDRQKAPQQLWALLPFLLLGRPEGMMWAGVLLAAESAAQYLAGKPLRLWIHHTLVSLLVYGVSLGAITAFRLWYFGHPLPNTYYAKVSPDRMYTLQTGWQYFLGFTRSQPVLPFLIGSVLALGLVFSVAVIAAAYRRLSSPQKPAFSTSPHLLASFVTAAATLAGLVAPILVGGDHFDGFRFYQPIWPLLPLPLCWFICHAQTALARKNIPGFSGRAIALSMVVLTLGCWAWGPDFVQWKTVGRRRLVDEFRLAKQGRQLGEALNRVFAGCEPEVGAIAVGGIQFAYKGWVNDLMGLSNIEMAHHPGPRKGIKNHAAFSKEVFYRQQPVVMVPVAFPFHAQEHIDRPMPAEFRKYIHHRWVVEPLQGLPHDAEFRRLYTPALISRADTYAPESIGAFYRNDYLESLRTNARYVVVTFTP